MRSELQERLIRDQLERILAARVFSRSQRLIGFLRFVVEETLDGRGESLKEQTIASALYERQNGAQDDDSVVRADARRVRDKLREYYAESTGEPVIISLPKGAYVPQFTGVAPAKRQYPWIAAAAVLTLLAILIWIASRPSPPSPRIVALTQLPGGESDPSFSPDGRFVAFSWWSPPGPAPQDIWVQSIHGETLRRLTETPPPVGEHDPAWSPDGREIAFQRAGWGGRPIPDSGVFIVSSLGGGERGVSTSGRNPKWTPDGKALLIVEGTPSRIVRIDLTTGERREIIRARPGEEIVRFEISPDGANLAFVRSIRRGVSDIFVVPIGGGEPRRLTDWDAWMDGLTWTPDGRDIVYDVSGQSLWRIPVRSGPPGRGKPVPGLESLVTSAARALRPAISPPGPGHPARLAFQVQKTTVNLRMIDLEAAESGVLPAKPFLASSRVDMPGPFSADGDKVAFYSYLAGFSVQFWVAKRDGSGPRQIASAFQAPALKAGAWSPDGHWIAFEAAVDGNSDIYIVSGNGAELKRLTTDAATDVTPSWSQDERWVYYSSNRTGRPEIWKVSVSGGTPAQVTRTGGVEPAESLDGKYLYYLDPAGSENGIRSTARLKRATADGGDEQVILETARRGLWGTTAKGILFLADETNFEAIDRILPDGRIERIGRLPFLVPREFPRLTFSRDGHWALANQVDRRESDLMMIDNFQ